MDVFQRPAEWRQEAYTRQTHHRWCGETVGFECEHVPRLCPQMSRPRRTSLNPLPFLFFLCLPKHAAPHPQLNSINFTPANSKQGHLTFVYLFRFFLKKKKKTGPHCVAHTVLKLITLLPLPPKCCFYRCKTLRPGPTPCLHCL